MKLTEALRTIRVGSHVYNSIKKVRKLAEPAVLGVEAPALGVTRKECEDDSDWCFSFEDAITAAKNGHKISRAGWNGKNMFVYLVPGSTFVVNRAPLLGLLPEGTEVNYRPHFDMKYADGTYGVWLASHGDMTANDWFVV